MSQQIEFKFKENWNGKLNCNAFTTLRIDARFQVGQKYAFSHKGKIKGFVVVMAKRHLLITELNDWITYLDTGYNKADCIQLIKTMYKNMNINWSQRHLVWYLLKTVEQNKLM